jgi:hypothetical protein
VVRQFALRWAVLAAWRDALAQRGVRLEDPDEEALTRARIKIASGCFSACEIGCDLAPVEAVLTAADASGGEPSVDEWLERLGQAMTGEEEGLLELAPVRFRFADCGVPGCRCEAR